MGGKEEAREGINSHGMEAARECVLEDIENRGYPANAAAVNF